MARYTKIFENNSITHILTFRNNAFKVALPPSENGCRISKDKSFCEQLVSYFDNESEIDYLSKAGGLIDFGLDDEIEKGLKMLNRIEEV